MNDGDVIPVSRGLLKKWALQMEGAAELLASSGVADGVLAASAESLRVSVAQIALLACRRVGA